MDIVLIVVLVVGGLIASGAIFEVVSAQLARSRYKNPPGDLYDVGGHKLHLRRAGDDINSAATVVLEAGIGSHSIDWELVQPKIAEFARVVSYDRAGYGWSESSREPRTPQQIITELHQLLQAANVPAPYVLVGHSFGGLYVRAYTEQYPEEVAGLVLVESSHPDLLEERDSEPEIRRLRTVQRMQRIGLMRLMLPRILDRPKFFTDAADRKRYLAFTMLDSQNNLREGLPLFRDGIELSDVVDKPVVVISRQPDEDLAAERRWHEFQQDMVTLSEDARHLISEKTNHFISLADPDIVVNAVRSVLQNINRADNVADLGD